LSFKHSREYELSYPTVGDIETLGCFLCSDESGHGKANFNT